MMLTTRDAKGHAMDVYDLEFQCRLLKTVYFIGLGSSVSVLVAQSVKRLSRAILCVRKRKGRPSLKPADSKKLPSVRN